MLIQAARPNSASCRTGSFIALINNILTLTIYLLSTRKRKRIYKYSHLTMCVCVCALIKAIDCLFSFRNITVLTVSSRSTIIGHFESNMFHVY